MAPDFFEYLIYALYFGLPAFSVSWFAVALYRFSIAKYHMKRGKQQYSDSDLRSRKIQLIISSVLLGVIVLIVISFIVLLMMAVAFM